MRLYSVHVEPWSTAPDGAAEFVKQGICWPALVFTLAWALWHRMWLVALWLVAITAVVGVANELLGLHAVFMAAVQLAIGVAMALVGNDLRRLTLERAGYVERAVVAGDSLVAAEHRYFSLVATEG